MASSYKSFQIQLDHAQAAQKPQFKDSTTDKAGPAPGSGPASASRGSREFSGVEGGEPGQRRGGQADSRGESSRNRRDSIEDVDDGI